MAAQKRSKIFTHLWYAKEAEEEDPARSKRVTDALLKMVKLDIATLENAYRS